MDFADRVFKGGARRIYHTYNGEGLSPFGRLEDSPYVRLDGTTPRVETMNGITVGHANRADGKIHGDFLEIYSETCGVPAYFIGLPNLKGFMRLKDESFPGVMPGANRLWH